MVELAILLGIFSYVIFGLGIMGKIGDLTVLRGLGLFIILILIFLAVKKKFWHFFVNLYKEVKNDKFIFILTALLFIQILVNLIGALGPELGFDALWYHLTIPKIFLQQERIFFIKGNLFYYSVMPKLTEMFYLVSLAFSSSGILAKVIHFLFGIGCIFSLYNLSKRYLKTRESLLVCLIFYTTLIVGWQSITAYIDLARTFFEIIALDLFLKWTDDPNKKIFLWESAILSGLAISSKLIAFASLPIFLILIIVKSKKLLLAVYYSLLTILIALPWFVFAYLYTKNPVYPIFSKILDQGHNLIPFNLFKAVTDFWAIFYKPTDLISPIYLIFLPIIFLRAIIGGLKGKVKIIFNYCFLAMFFWYFTPRTGGSRFFLPYLPALSLLLVSTISTSNNFLKKSLIYLTIITAVINISYRALANFKFVPVLIGKESKEQFLSNRLNFKNGDFFDINKEIKDIVKKNYVKIENSHNLFYADFSFVHSSFSGNFPVGYVLTQYDDQLKKEFGNFVYSNPKTGVKLYLYKGKI